MRRRGPGERRQQSDGAYSLSDDGTELLTNGQHH